MDAVADLGVPAGTEGVIFIGLSNLFCLNPHCQKKRRGKGADKDTQTPEENFLTLPLNGRIIVNTANPIQYGRLIPHYKQQRKLHVV